MGVRHDRQCASCEKWEVEVIDEWESDFCQGCNDRAVERSNRQREWDYYHPGQPAPKEEL